MLTEESMKIAMQKYIDGFNKKDAKLLISLFSKNCRIEDPVGGKNIVEGKDAISKFYQQAITMVDRLELVAPIRGSQSNFAAMAFKIFMPIEEKNYTISVIDVMEFDESGKIIDMKAYHGSSDMQEI